MVWILNTHPDLRLGNLHFMRYRKLGNWHNFMSFPEYIQISLLSSDIQHKNDTFRYHNLPISQTSKWSRILCAFEFTIAGSKHWSIPQSKCEREKEGNKKKEYSNGLRKSTTNVRDVTWLWWLIFSSWFFSLSPLLSLLRFSFHNFIRDINYNEPKWCENLKSIELFYCYEW